MRKSVDVTITAEGRDKGKVFVLTELPAARAERWATRLFLALAKSGVDIPEDVSSAGMAGIAAIGLKALAGISFAEAEPLLDEMFTCIRIKPSPQTNPEIVRDLLLSGDDIEEVQTRLKLRLEVLALHVNFSTAGGLSKSTSAEASAVSHSAPTSHRGSLQ